MVGLSGAVGTDETEDFAVTNAKGHIPQGLSLPEGLIEVVNGQGGHELVLRVLVEGQCITDSGQGARDEVAKKQVVADSEKKFSAIYFEGISAQKPKIGCESSQSSDE